LLEAELMSTCFGSVVLLGRNPTHLQQKFIYFISSYATQKILSLSRKKGAAFQNAKKWALEQVCFLLVEMSVICRGQVGLDNRPFRYIENILLVRGLLFWMFRL
jgi:hypothetical protein